jgi:5'(3')-deoxyribonucleotidase
MLKNEQGLDINLFAGAVRLRKTLEKKGLSEELIESFIENIDTHCFRHNIRFAEFVDTINELSALSDSFGIQLNQLPKHIQEEEIRLKALKEQIKSARQKRDRLLKEYDLTTHDLKGYDRFKPQLHNYISIERELQNCRLQLVSEISSRKMARYIDQYDLNILNEHLDNPVSAKELLNMLDYVRYSPIKNIDVIKLMQEKVSEHPELLLIDQPSDNK